jgi:hypothetical protein
MPDEGTHMLPSPPVALPDAAAVATCAGCGAPLAADQRYCLACGRPCSPVRLAFLDVLQSEHATAPTAVLGAPPAAGYPPPSEPAGTLAALRRYSGLFGLLGVLLVSLLIGLLVGHWLSGGTGSGKQVLEVKGFGSLAAAPATSAGSAGSGGTSTGSGSGGSSSTGHHGSSSTGSAASHSQASTHNEGGVEESAAEEAAAVKEVQTTKPLPAATTVSSKTEHTTGKQHSKELKEQGAAPLVSK